MNIDIEKEELASKLKGSFLEFTKTFYYLLTGRNFIISTPPFRESHTITISRALTRAARLELPQHRLWISVPPGHGKSTMLVFWVAWTMAQYPDSKYLYISYSASLASKHTETIKRIIQLNHYKYLFGISIRHDARGKEFFQTTSGGAVAAFGSTGSIVGTDGGLPGLDRFSGAVLMDDLHKIDEAHSDTIRNSVITNYRETIQQRARGINVPMIGIGQRVHENDITAYLLNNNDGNNWEHVILPSIDKSGYPLYPEVYPLNVLKNKEKYDPYIFASQFQQNPIPAGGALFKEEWFEILDEEPEILSTFITIDSAETEKRHNDATAMSFWGFYKLKHRSIDLDMYGLHWLNCWEEWLEPKDLEERFMDFYISCMRYPVKPSLVAIEKKSTGTYLLSLLKKRQGLILIDVDRTAADGSKMDRFIQMQPFIASRQITVPLHGKHNSMVIQHMSKVTANNTHARDDVADTAQIACDLAFTRKIITGQSTDGRKKTEDKVNKVMRSFMQNNKVKR